ncbi:hypothetical protein M3610_16320 [Neobacillus sp. MER 74]|uniref:hypothetical protein n=1 Tax=Neobacillus sp. MER 74 TaxID=2939566 RepID=UPI00203A77CD|nr:hypothetical protein [Neobacillus sp. MER 74]MCM3116844.1 hypothetical protein [Neobacillus sp. MER 74]
MTAAKEKNEIALVQTPEEPEGKGYLYKPDRPFTERTYSPYEYIDIKTNGYEIDESITHFTLSITEVKGLPRYRLVYQDINLEPIETFYFESFIDLNHFLTVNSFYQFINQK